MASRSRTSRRLLPSRWRCGPNRRRSIRGPRAAWVFLFRWLTAGVLGLASQCDALGHVQPRMDHEGRQDDEEEKQRKKHVVHLGTLRYLTSIDMLAVALSHRHSTARVREPLFPPGLLHNATNGASRRTYAEYSSRYFLTRKFCDSYFAACSKMALERFNASVSAESWADVRAASFASIPSFTPGITTAA